MKYDLTQLDLSDLNPELLEHLVKVGEPLHVERKKKVPPPEELSELMGSLANTEGGWALLGVGDNGEIIGLPDGRTDLQDQIRDQVRKKLEPLPNFAARRVAYEGKEIGILRVYRSEDTPLVCTHKGAVYIRLPGGKEPITSRRQLDDLVVRGASTDAAGSARLDKLAVAAKVLEADDLTGARSYVEPVHREWVLSVTPIGLDEGFAGRTQTRVVREAAEKTALQLLPTVHGFAGQEFVETQAGSPGWYSWAERVGDAASRGVVVDPAGVITVMARERGVRTVIDVDPVIDNTIAPLLAGALNVLAAAGAPGRSVCRLHARGFAGVMLQAFPDGAVQVPQGTRHSGTHRVSGTAGTGDLRAVAKRLVLDVANHAGLVAFS